MACTAEFYLINDQIINTINFDIGVLEKGFTIYEVVKIINGKPLFIEDHTRRLHQSAKYKNVSIWLSDNYIKKSVLKLIEINNVLNGRLKYAFRYYKDDNKFICFFLEDIEPPATVYIKGVKIISEKYQRESPNAKVINYSLRKRVKEIKSEMNAFETLLISRDGKITECSKSNIFFIKKNTVFTTFKEDVLPGITRNYIISLCHKLSIQIQEKDIYYTDLEYFDSVFISGTSIGILIVSAIDEFQFSTNNKIINQLTSAYKKLVSKYLD